LKKKRDLLTRMAGYITAAASQVVEKRDFFDSMKSNAHRHTDTLTHTHTRFLLSFVPGVYFLL
jgi:hypothetical protein